MLWTNKFATIVPLIESAIKCVVDIYYDTGKGPEI